MHRNSGKPYKPTHRVGCISTRFLSMRNCVRTCNRELQSKPPRLLDSGVTISRDKTLCGGTDARNTFPPFIWWYVDAGFEGILVSMD